MASGSHSGPHGVMGNIKFWDIRSGNVVWELKESVDCFTDVNVMDNLSAIFKVGVNSGEVFFSDMRNMSAENSWECLGDKRKAMRGKKEGVGCKIQSHNNQVFCSKGGDLELWSEVMVGSLRKTNFCADGRVFRKNLMGREKDIGGRRITRSILYFGYDEALRGYTIMKVTDVPYLRNGEPLIGILTFIWKLGGGAGGNLLETEVERFISTVIAGEFKFLRHLDVSNWEGLASEEDWCNRCNDPSFIPTEELYRERPDFYLLAEFPLERSFLEFGQMIGSDDVSLHSQLSSRMFDGPCFMNTSDSSYNSDLGSGNEDGHDTSFIIYMESSDEADFLSI